MTATHPRVGAPLPDPRQAADRILDRVQPAITGAMAPRAISEVLRPHVEATVGQGSMTTSVGLRQGRPGHTGDHPGPGLTEVVAIAHRTKCRGHLMPEAHTGATDPLLMVEGRTMGRLVGRASWVGLLGDPALGVVRTSLVVAGRPDLMTGMALALVGAPLGQWGL